MFIGIDIGTSRSQGVLVAPDGAIVDRAHISHSTSQPRPGWAEHDAERVWWRDFRVLSQTLVRGVNPRELRAVGVSGLGPCVLPADAQGRPLRPAILYGVDSRAVAEIAEVEAELGPAAVRLACGAPVTTQAVGPKLRWLRTHEPETYDHMRTVFSCASYLVHRLSGSYVLDHSTASHFVPLYDLRASDWHARWATIDTGGLELPRLVWPSEIVGEVSPEAAQETGLPRGLPVNGGALDACAESVSVGVRHPGDTMVMYGTTMVLAEIIEASVEPGVLWLTNGALTHSRLLVGSVTTSGSVAAWIAGVIGRSSGTLMSEAASVPPGSHGLILLPYFAGERIPFANPDARGVLAGLTTSHTPADLYRAALEGTAYAARHNLLAAEAAAGRPRRLAAVGGGTSGDLWVQIVTDVVGLPQDVHRETVGAALGDAMLAAMALGFSGDPWAWNPVLRTVVPDPARHAIYAEYFAEAMRLYEATRTTAEFLASRQRRLDPPS